MLYVFAKFDSRRFPPSMPLTKAEISRLRQLREKKHREAVSLFVIEGEKVIQELLAANYPLLEIYATADWLEGNDAPIAHDESGQDEAGRLSVIPITREEMTRASHFPTPSSVLALGK